MLRTVVRLTPTFIFPIFEDRNKYDYDKIHEGTKEIPQTGWDRVKQMYRRNEYEETSVELHNVIQATMCGAFFGGCLGGLASSREAYLTFIENNQATIFTSTMQAKKKLQDYVTVAFAKGAYRWGWKLGIFTGMFRAVTSLLYAQCKLSKLRPFCAPGLVILRLSRICALCLGTAGTALVTALLLCLTATTISVYRGDTSLVEYITAGAIAGALYKVNLGLAATLVGAGLGAALSTIGGLAILGILKITGFSMDDIRRAMYKLKASREDQYNQAVEKSAKIKNDEMTKHHDLLVEEKGAKKIDEL